MIAFVSSTEEDTVLVRAILQAAQHVANEENKGSIDEDDGYIPCCLRYQLALRNGSILRHTFLDRRAKPEGYADDDAHRLTGEGYGGGLAKEAFESLLRAWFETRFLPPPDPVASELQIRRSRLATNRAWNLAALKQAGGANASPTQAPISLGYTSPGFSWGAQVAKSYAKLDEVLSKLVPPSLLPRIQGLSLLVDIYLNRTVVGWHKDWNDGHALIVGLLNISNRALGSTEFIHDPESIPREATHELVTGCTTSPLRIAIRDAAWEKYEGDRVVHKTKRSHAEGTMRWFNDVVWIHRTPPDGTRPGGASLLQEVNDATYGIDGKPYKFSPNVKLNLTDPARYSTAPLEPRMLMRVTLRDLYRG